MNAFRFAAALALGASTVVAGQDYPSRPIKFIAPLAAASAVDAAARVVAAKMSENMGQQIVVENLPGAAGLIGADRVAKAAPDGYTFGAFNDSVMTMVPNMHDKMPWDTLKDFDPVSLVGTIEWGLVVGVDKPYKSAGELIAAAKAAPGKIDYGSGGNGSPQHVGMALFASTAGIQMQHVPYKGATQAAVGVAGGEVAAAFQGLGTVTPLIQAGKLRLIGVATPQRMATRPEVPTVAESGLPGYQFNSWFAVYAPAGTPRAMVNRLSEEIRKALADPGVREKLTQQGFTIRGSTPEELGSATREQLARYQKLMKEAGIKAD
ncbi:MAG: Bug family tripartite tricarboxylate transporter substrate binding protein [Gemmatimonadales bacterium]